MMYMTEKELRVPFSALLNELDTEVWIYRCSANDLVQGICAFTSDDCIFHKSPRAWKNSLTS